MAETKKEKKSTREARKASSIRGTAEREKYLKLKKFALGHEKEKLLPEILYIAKSVAKSS